MPARAARLLAPKLPVVAVTLQTPPDGPLVSPTAPFRVRAVLPERIARLALTQTLQVFVRALDIGQRQLSEMRLKLDAPEVSIHPDVGHISLLERVEVPEVAALGEQAALEALPALRKAVSFRARVRRAFGRGGAL